MQTIKVSYYSEVPDNYTGIIERADGTKSWYVDGKLHRLDGPAREMADGSKEWYVDGKLHRLNGPAIEWANGNKSWWVDGVKVSESAYPEAVRMYKIKMVLG